MTPAPPRPLRVLIVEDEPLIAMSIEFSVECLGQEVVGPVGRLGEAMAAAASDDCDCAVIDINIIGGTSYGVARTLAARHRPFILASGYSDSSLPADMQNRPRLMKPYSDDQLAAALNQMFESCQQD
jgi:DNA-binding NarL/FixJ family response regulator